MPGEVDSNKLNFKDIEQIEDTDKSNKLLDLLSTRTTDIHLGDHDKYTENLSENFEKLENLTQDIGWPSAKKLENEFDLTTKTSQALEYSAFLTAQHLDANIVPIQKSEDGVKWNPTEGKNDEPWKEILENRVEKQKQVLGWVHDEISRGNASELTAGFAAYLEDRTLRNQNKAQEYGTQGQPYRDFDTEKKESIPQDMKVNLSSGGDEPKHEVSLSELKGSGAESENQRSEILEKRKQNGLENDTAKWQKNAPPDNEFEPVNFVSKQIRDSVHDINHVLREVETSRENIKNKEIKQQAQEVGDGLKNHITREESNNTPNKTPAESKKTQSKSGGIG